MNQLATFIQLRIPKVYGRCPELTSGLNATLGDLYGDVIWITMAWGPHFYRCICFGRN